MREEGRPTEEHVRLAASQLLKPVEQGLVDGLGPKVVDEMVIINCDLLSRTRVENQERIDKHYSSGTMYGH